MYKGIDLEGFQCLGNGNRMLMKNEFLVVLCRNFSFSEKFWLALSNW